MDVFLLFSVKAFRAPMCLFYHRPRGKEKGVLALHNGGGFIGINFSHDHSITLLLSNSLSG